MRDEIKYCLFGVFLWAHLKKMSRLTNRMV